MKRPKRSGCFVPFTGGSTAMEPRETHGVRALDRERRPRASRAAAEG